MQVQQQIFFHVNEHEHWQKGQTYFIGNANSPRYETLIHREFLHTNSQGAQIPISAIAQGMGTYLGTQQRPDYMRDYHFDTAQTLGEVLPMIRSQQVLIRELLFEEVRQQFFPQQLSRYRALQVIPANKEALALWLPSLRTPQAKIFKLKLSGQLHQADSDWLGLDSVSAEQIRYNAYQYWLGTTAQDAPGNECIFRGVAEVLDIIDAQSIAKEKK